MNKAIVVAIPITIVLIAAVAGIIVTNNTNSLQVVETAYMVVHPAANKGDTIVFQTLSSSGGTAYVHFPLQSPCATQDVAGAPGSPPQCKVTATVNATALAQYPYTIDSSPGPVHPSPQGICRACCRMCQIVIRNPKPDQLHILSGLAGSGPYPADEILIDESGANLVAQNTGVYPGQPVKWYRAGTADTAWSVTFDDPTACSEKKPIGSGVVQSPVCTFAGKVSNSPYKYTMHVGTKSGPGFLYVNPPIPPN